MPLRRELKQARDERRLVRVGRAKGWAQHDGYVVAVGRVWSAVRVVEGGLPEGLVLVRTGDVCALRTPSSNRRLSKRALKAEGHWPPTCPELLDLHDVRSVLFTAGSLAPVLAVATEERKAGVFFVGNVFRITDKHLQLHEITPRGTWRKRLTEWPLTCVTRVDLGSRYLDTVHAAAGPRSTP